VNREHIIKSWRNEEYRESLDARTRELLPESPVGAVDLSEADLTAVFGGNEAPIDTTTLTSLTPYLIEYSVSVIEGGSCRMGTNGCC
jgi:mersacidin/lichenicidin family type 2 lantibiotic